jgi:cation diffusion facilitator CzcD-associated flavoprotein CzcO
VSEIHWKSDLQKWQVTVIKDGRPSHETNTPVNEFPPKIYYSNWLVMGTGYYDYHTPLQTVIPGLESFKGTIIHPQFWDTTIDMTDKRVAIIGSGATAVTLVPALSATASHVTMIQRSPGYFVMPPVSDGFNLWARRWLPSNLAYKIMRWRMIIILLALIQFCWWLPKLAARVLKADTARQLPPDTTLTMEKDFTPTYTPMQQRLCISPGGDFFAALKSGRADVVTGKIAHVTSNGVQMQPDDSSSDGPGRFVEADILITATGLKITVGGHARLLVDGAPLSITDKFIWKGTMVQDVPNFAVIVGYVDHPWTLGADATCRLFTRIMREAEKRGASRVTPVMSEREKGEVKEVPYIGIDSTYLKTAKERRSLPRGGDRGPWVPRHNYLKDHWAAEWGGFGGLVFGRESAE